MGTIQTNTDADLAGAKPDLNSRLRIPEHDLVHRIGSGSYGEVWLARNRLGELRALKLVRQSTFEETGPFEREFNGLRTFEPLSRTHPGFVPILQAGRDDAAGFFYYVMELADADEATAQVPVVAPANAEPAGQSPATYRPRTLRAELKRRDRLPVGECLSITIGIAEALVALHAARLVHRDIKPANLIFIGGQARLADIGLVTSVDDARSFVGTVGYIPPEGPGTPAADLYSLGKVLYEMATGRDRDAFPSLPAGWQESPDRRDLEELREIFNRACDPRPEQRYASATAMLADLRRLQQGGSLRRRRQRRERIRWAFRLSVPTMLLALLVVTFQQEWLGIGSSLDRQQFTSPHVDNWAAGMFGQGDANLRDQEFFVHEGATITTTTWKGERLRSWNFPATDAIGRHLKGVADLQGNGQSEMLVTWRQGTNVVLEAVSLEGRTVRRFDFAGQSYVDERGVTNFTSEAGLLGTVAWPPDGKKVILGGLFTGHMGRYGKAQRRELTALDPVSGKILWKVPVTSGPASWLAYTNSAGRWELLYGSYAPANGVQTPDGARDDHSYLWRIDASGTVLARVEQGEFYTSPGLADLGVGKDGKWSSLVWLRMEADLRQREGGKEFGWLHRIDEHGAQLAGWAGRHYIETASGVRWQAGASAQIVAMDAKGCLRLFDEQLRLLREVPLTQHPHDRVQGRIVGVRDLDGDGIAELIILHTSHEFGMKRSVSPGLGPYNHGRHHENELVILDPDLVVKARYQLPADLPNPPNAHLLDVDDDGRPEIAILSRELIYLRWRPWWQRWMPWKNR